RGPVLPRRSVVADAVAPHAGAALRVARPSPGTGSREASAGLEVKTDRRHVVTLRIRQQPELADCEAEHQRAAELCRAVAALLERLPSACEVVEEKTNETEPRERTRDDEVVAGRSTDIDCLFQTDDRRRVDVAVAVVRAEREQADAELSGQP